MPGVMLHVDGRTQGVIGVIKVVCSCRLFSISGDRFQGVGHVVQQLASVFRCIDVFRKSQGT